MYYGIITALLLAGCAEAVPSQPPLAEADPSTPITQQASSVSESEARNVADTDDGLAAPTDSYVPKIAGKFGLWQNDRGEDGLMCAIELLPSRTIGGYAVTGDERCLEKIGIEDLSAWFLAEEDDHLVLTAATRRPVMRLKRAEDGYYYFGNDQFYISRSGM